MRFSGTPLRNLAVFKDLCGDDNLENVVLVTTMWDEVPNESVGAERESQLLSDFWKDMTSHGSRTRRFAGTRESAWEVINCLDLKISHQMRRPSQVQEETVDRGLPLHETTAAKNLFHFLVQLAAESKKAWAKLRNRAGRVTKLKDHPRRDTLGRFPTMRPAPPHAATSADITAAASPESTSPPSPADSHCSGCSANGYQDALSAAIGVLRLAYQAADIGHIPMLRGIIGTVLHIAQLIQVSYPAADGLAPLLNAFKEMGGTHHMINQVVQNSGWLLDEIMQHTAPSALSEDMNKALKSFQKYVVSNCLPRGRGRQHTYHHLRELKRLQKVVTKISNRGRIARFLLHDADIDALTACAASIKAVHDKLGVRSCSIPALNLANGV